MAQAGTSDSILAKVSNGEFIVRASQASKHAALLEAINAGRVPAFANGGMVGGAPLMVGGGGASVSVVNQIKVESGAAPRRKIRTWRNRSPVRSRLQPGARSQTR
jgi:hypothetical protein